MRPAVGRFWKEVRRQLRGDLGQERGKRDKNKALRRARLAQELKLSDVTLRSFLNGNQATLGPEALFVLFAKAPHLKNRYEEATGKSSRAVKTQQQKLDRGLLIQMTFQFEGSDDPPRSLTARLPAGRAGTLTVKIDRSRIA
jgi:hypothetical protein